MKITVIVRQFFTFSILFLMSEISGAQLWATAISRNEAKGTAIIYRYVKEFFQGFVRNQQPDRITVVWRYRGEKGMPSLEERERMVDFDDALSPLEEAGFSTLALVSTGNDLKEWTYYTQAEDAFLERLNGALRSKATLPIEIHASPDPEWTTYERFVIGVKN